MAQTIPFEDADPRLKEVYAYWQTKRGGRAMPSRRDIDPLDIPAVLPHLMMIDVEPGPRYRYRLFGTEVTEAFGMNPTGKCVDEVMVGDYKIFLLGLYDDLCRDKKPVYSTSIYGGGKHAAGRDTKMWTQRLMLPLSSDGANVDKVIACQVFVHGSPLHTLTVRLAQDKAEPIGNARAALK